MNSNTTDGIKTIGYIKIKNHLHSWMNSGKSFEIDYSQTIPQCMEYLFSNIPSRKIREHFTDLFCSGTVPADLIFKKTHYKIREIIPDQSITQQPSTIIKQKRF